MEGYGYTYLSISTYNTVRDETRGPVVKPFVPFVPNTNSNSEGQVTKKTIVPVATKPYVDDYPASDDGYGSPSKVDEFLTKVQNEASHPKRSTPVSSTDRRQLPQPVSFNDRANGYSDRGGNKEGHKLVGYDGRSGYGDYGSHKEGIKPVGVTFRNDNYDGYNNPNDYGAYNSKEGYKSNSNYDGYNGANDGYGGYINKEGHRPYGSTTKNDNYDGFHGGNGYGDYGNYGKKEGYKPFGSPILSGKVPNKIIPGKPNISTAWTVSPRKGTQLSDPTNDIDMAVQMLKEAANLSGHNNKGGHNYDEPTSKFGNIGTPHSRYSVPIEQSSPNKDNRDATGWEYAERYGNASIIDSREAEKRYGGRRV
ncbi:PREDICTED: uncharacterized protein LOC109345429 isoform X1 [Lupinus angustifolius]|uniref:uncharacterized protein LOC109345429 isoform X1 n=1 Tax=Lupinus angustifolius TaxID=3871 RepID=UPI00092F3A90|nr:PREDICTED: uncharacterized protein LOC109345429 isoform X1 [Lupinus angustifolius]